MNIEELKQNWERDCEIDEIHLDREVLNTSRLHSKYINELIDTRLRLVKAKNDYAAYAMLKSRYYRGELTEEELKRYGWEQWQTLTPRSEIEKMLKADSECIKYELKVEMYLAMIDMLDSILKQLSSRDYAISNAIKWKIFSAGG